MINKQQTTFPNGIIDLSPINHNPYRETKKRSSEQQKAIDIVATTRSVTCQQNCEGHFFGIMGKQKNSR